jgi:hypothetical protein
VKLAPIAALAALIPFSASLSAVPAIPDMPTSESQLSASAPWWEKLVVTVGEEGETRACLYETSDDPGQRKPCDVEGMVSANVPAGLPEQVTRITFERRFSPAASLADGEVAAGDSLLGKSVLALAIDGEGRVRGCKVVATGGMKPDYGCAEAAAEKFEASTGAQAAVAAKVATLTILVYAHEEDQV